MPNPVAESKINAIQQEYAEVAAQVSVALGNLSDEDLKKSSGNSGWRRQVVAAHLAKATGSVIGYSQRVRDGKNVNVPGGRRVLDLFNRAGAFVSRNMKPAQMVEAHAEGGQKFAAELEKSRDADWERKVVVLGKETDLEGWFRALIDHEREHLAELRAGVS